ncbi:MAG: CPBP family intramembrane metalloprotease [Proteobacteria bacterium]|nr:CPBP family intramembrane metalloprotease [Pseudomonadota bacterium]
MTRRIITIIGLLLALGMPLVGPSRFAPAIAGVPHAVAAEICWWILALVVLGYVLVVERRTLGSIGFRRPTWRTFASGAGAAVVVVIGMGLLLQFVFAKLHIQYNAAAVHKLGAMPFGLKLAMVTRAAFVEEILFRGYGIERLAELTGSRWLAGAITLAVFAYAHITFWGWTQIIIAGAAGLVLTMLYLWRRDLGSNIVAHWLVDGVGLLLRA